MFNNKEIKELQDEVEKLKKTLGPMFSYENGKYMHGYFSEYPEYDYMSHYERISAIEKFLGIKYVYKKECKEDKGFLKIK